MQSVEVENFLAQGLAGMGLHLENQDEALSRLNIYFQELKKWNRKINLVGRKQDGQVILENHFLDSLSLLPLLAQEQLELEKLLDIGTGAGFPGLVIKTVMPRLSVTLMEPRQSRYYFLRHIVRTLQLDGVDLLPVRLERNSQLRELRTRKFTFVTSRAFSDIEELVMLTSELLAVDGRIVCMKGPRGMDELKAFQQSAISKEFAAGLQKTQLPFSGAERNLVILKKC
jgi:16S rRNA (guanine527-N7)-methyltransferase